MQQFAEPVTDKQGNALVGAQVTVYTTGGYLATLYAADEVTVIGNPVTTDERGMCVFKAQNGNYRRTVTFSGVTYDVAGEISLNTPGIIPIQISQTKYRDGAPVLLFGVNIASTGARNVIQGHAFDLPNNQFYALQLKDSANAFFVRRVKFGNSAITSNVTDINPGSDLIVHQGLFIDDVAGVRYLWAGGDAGSPIQLVRVRESDGAVTTFPFNPSLTPGAVGVWDGNITQCLNVAGTKLFVRVGNQFGDSILRYDWPTFKAGSATAIAEAMFPVAVEQYSGTSFQGIAADEDTVYILSGNTTQTLNKLLYAYDMSGNILWKRVVAPHYFESFRNGTKCEVEGLHIIQLPTGQRMLTLMMEMGTPSHNVHRMYGIPQFLNEASFAASTPGLFFDDYGAVGVGGVPVGSGSCLLQVINPQAATTRFAVTHAGCVGPNGGGVHLTMSSNLSAAVLQRELAVLSFLTNNLTRMVLAADRARLDIGSGEVGPQPNGSPGYRLGLNIGALSVQDGATTPQEILRLGWSEGSQDLGIGEGVKIVFGVTLVGGSFTPVGGFGTSKVTGSDSDTDSDIFLEQSQSTGSAPVTTHVWQKGGTYRPGTDNAQSLGSSAFRFLTGFITRLFFGTGGTASLNGGAGSPETVISAAVGSIYTDTTNGVMYVKKSGTGNTGWKLVTQAP